MSFITSVFLIIVGFFLWRGYKKGFIASLAQILSLAIAYPAAIFLTNPVANFIFSHTAFTGMMVYFAAGSAVFFMVGLLVTSLIKGIARSFPHSDFTVNGSRIGGALIGVLVGGTVGLIAVYAIDLTQKPPAEEIPIAADSTEVPTPASPATASQTPGPARKPAAKLSASDKFIEASAKKFVSTAAATAVDFALKDKTATHVTKTFSQNPQKMLGHIQNLSNDGELKALMTNPEIQQLLRNGDTQALLDNWNFQHLMNNEDMQAVLVGAEDTENGKTSQQVAAEKIVEAWQHSDAIKNDPRVVAIINDPEFQQQLNSPNKLPLILNPKLKALTDIIFSNDYKTGAASDADQIEIYTQQQQPPSNPQSATSSPQPARKQTEAEQPRIYRWTDSSGKVHYTDAAGKP